MLNETDLTQAAEQLAAELQRTNTRIVFAESCTAGLVAAALSRIPGVSEYHCGSAVVYRNGTKAAWLGVPESLLEDPGPVSDVVAQAMATGVLQKTPEASLSTVVTGHLGPNAPPELDGVIYVATAEKSSSPSPAVISVSRHTLETTPTNITAANALALRHRRQLAAAVIVLDTAAQQLKNQH